MKEITAYLEDKVFEKENGEKVEYTSMYFTVDGYRINLAIKQQDYKLFKYLKEEGKI